MGRIAYLRDSISKKGTSLQAAFDSAGESLKHQLTLVKDRILVLKKLRDEIPDEAGSVKVMNKLLAMIVQKDYAKFRAEIPKYEAQANELQFLADSVKLQKDPKADVFELSPTPLGQTIIDNFRPLVNSALTGIGFRTDKQENAAKREEVASAKAKKSEEAGKRMGGTRRISIDELCQIVSGKRADPSAGSEAKSEGEKKKKLEKPEDETWTYQVFNAPGEKFLREEIREGLASVDRNPIKDGAFIVKVTDAGVVYINKIQKMKNGSHLITAKLWLDET